MKSIDAEFIIHILTGKDKEVGHDLVAVTLLTEELAKNSRKGRKPKAKPEFTPVEGSDA